MNKAESVTGTNHRARRLFVLGVESKLQSRLSHGAIVPSIAGTVITPRRKRDQTDPRRVAPFTNIGF